MVPFLLLVFFINYGYCCIHSFPVLTGASYQCSNNTDSCMVTCQQERIFYDGNLTKEYTCKDSRIWNPIVPGQGCLERIEATFWLRFEISYRTSGIALFCLQAHEKSLIDNKELFKSQVSHYCNNQIISVGDITIDSMDSTTSSLTITTVFHLQIGDSSTTKADKQACQSVLIANSDSSDLFIYGNSLQCNSSTASVSRSSININPDVSTCPVNHVLVTDPSNNDYCVLNQPVVGAQSFRYDANITQDIILHCKVLFGKEVLQVYWQHDSKTVSVSTSNKYNGSSTAYPSLQLQNVTYDDAGNYQCFAKNDFGTEKSPEIVLNVIPRTEDIPEVTISNSHYEVVAGEDIILECVVFAFPPVNTIEWFRNISVSNEKIDASVAFNGGNITMPSIELIEVSLKDSGHYTCTATNIAGTGTSSPSFLEVKGDIPEVTTMESNTSTVLGENVTLSCSYTSLPKVYSVNWQFNRSGSLTNITVDGKKYSGSTVTSPFLNITYVTFHDTGNYTCSVTNFVGIGTSHPVMLEVVGDPPMVNIGTPLYSVIVGENITMECKVTGTPSPLSVAWYRNSTNGLVLVPVIDDRFSGGSLDIPSLTVTDVRNGDEGWYICSAKSLAGTTYSDNVFLNITGAEPRVRIASTEYEVIFGETIKLECNISAHPLITSVQWQIKDGNGIVDVEIENSIHFSGASIEMPSLQVAKVNFTHEGLYRCTASNSVGTGFSNFTGLNVIGDIPTIKIKSSQYDAILTTNVTMACNISGVPDVLEVTWKKRHLNSTSDISIDAIKHIGGTIEDNDLTITNLINNDSGSYICSARNLIGTSESDDILLNVTGGLPVVLMPEESYQAILGDEVILECSSYAHPLPTDIIWLHIHSNGTSTTIDPDSSQYTLSDYPSPSLKIHSVMFSDKGEYKCVVRNIVGEHMNKTLLSVEGDPPSVSVYTVQYNILEDDNVTMQCNVSGIPAVQSVRWQINSTGSASSDFIGGNLTDPSLTLFVARLKDTGWYTCTATNLAGTTDGQLVYLNVSEKCIKYLPEIPNSDVTCSYSDGSGSCAVTCVSPYIYRDGTERKQYSCTGRNKWSPPLPVSTCLETTPSTFRIDISINYKTSYFAVFCKDAHEKSISDSTEDLIRQIDLYCNNQFVAVGPIVINRTETTTSSFDINTKFQVIIGNSETSKENKEACKSIVRLNMNERTFLVYGTNLLCNTTVATVEKQDGATVDSTVLCPEKFTLISGSHICVSQIPVVATNQTEYTASVGDSVTLRCEINSDLLITDVFWHFTPFGTDERNLLSMLESRFSGGTPENADLTMSGVSHADIGTFRCTANNSAGAGYGPDIALAVQTSGIDLPQVKITRADYNVVLGNNLTLECKVKSDLLITNVVWQQEKYGVFRDIEIDGITSSGSLPSNPNLVIIGARFEQAGEYKCTATNFAGTQKSNITVVKVSGDKPVVNVPSKFYTVQFGHNVTFYCSITAVPSVKNVSWLHNVSDGTTHVIIDNKNYFSTIDNPSLTIVTATSKDIGWYICVGINLAGTTYSEQIYFNVTANVPVVNIPVEFYEVEAGERVILECHIFAYPTLLSTNWSRYSEKLAEFVAITDTSKFTFGDISDPSLRINNVQLNDSGSYLCQGTNAKGPAYGSPISLTVKGGPPLVSIPSSYSVLYGLNVTLDCKITATPNISSVMWFKTTQEGDIVIDINLDKYIGGTVVNPSLTLPFVKFVDKGEYTCSGTNIVGSGRSKTHLIVEGGVPVIEVMSIKYDVEIGANITLHCNISGSPTATTVEWKTNTTGLSGVRHSGGTLEEPTLTISNVRVTDAGWYTCTAANIVGSASSVPVYLNVTGEEVCIDEYFPRISNAATICTENSQLFCTVTCNVGHVTRDGNTTSYFTCENNAWIPELPPKGCIEYVMPFTEYKFAVTYRLTFNASYCLTGTKEMINRLKPAFEQQAMTACNNAGFSVGVLELSDIKFSTSNFLVYTEYTLRTKLNTISYSDRAFCKVLLQSYSSDNIIFTIGGSVDCGIANSTIDTPDVDFRSSVDVCPNSTSTVSTSAETFCVFDVPSVVAGRPTYTAENGNSVTLGCNVESNAPILSVHWIINITGQFQTIYGNDTSEKYRGSTPQTPALTVVNLDFVDMGYYTCHAINSIGEGSSSAVRLNVIERVRALPVITNGNTNLQYEEGQTAEIICSINKKSEPSTVFWQFSSGSSSAIYQPFTFNDRFTGSTEEMPSLKIRSLQEADTGYYTCHAVNVLGVGKGDPVRLVVRKLGQGPNGASVGESTSASDKLSCLRTFGFLLVFAAVGIAILNVACILFYNIIPPDKSSMIRNIRQWRISEKIAVIIAEVLLSIVTACAVAGIITVVTCSDNVTGATLGLVAIAIVAGIILALSYLALCGYIMSKKLTRVNNRADDAGLLPSHGVEPDEHAKMKSWRHYEADLPAIERFELKKEEVDVPTEDEQEVYASAFAKKPHDIYASTFRTEPLISTPTGSLTPGRHAQSLPPIDFRDGREERKKRRRKKKKKRREETFDAMHESDGGF